MISLLYKHLIYFRNFITSNNILSIVWLFQRMFYAADPDDYTQVHQVPVKSPKFGEQHSSQAR